MVQGGENGGGGSRIAAGEGGGWTPAEAQRLPRYLLPTDQSGIPCYEAKKKRTDGHNQTNGRTQSRPHLGLWFGQPGMHLLTAPPTGRALGCNAKAD